MELTIYETFEDFKENYLKDLPAYPGDLLGYLNEYLVLYNDVFAESDKLSAYFYPRDEDDEPLPDHPEIVYPVNRKIFELQLQQSDYYSKNSYNEEINETLYQFLLFGERLYEFLEKEIQRVEIELKFIKQWGPGGFQQTALQVDPEPDSREPWRQIYEEWKNRYKGTKHERAEFGYLYWKLIEDKLLDRDKFPQRSFESYLSDDDIIFTSQFLTEAKALEESKDKTKRDHIYELIKINLKL